MTFRAVWKVDRAATARRVWAEVRVVGRVWAEMLLDDCFGASAQIAFYFLLGFFPFVTFLAASATTIGNLPPAQLEQATLWLLSQVMPRQALDIVSENVAQIIQALQRQNL